MFDVKSDPGGKNRRQHAFASRNQPPAQPGLLALPKQIGSKNIICGGNVRGNRNIVKRGNSRLEL